jgi:hypothetical protein
MKTLFTTSDMYGATTYKIVQAKPECYYTEFVGYAPNVPLTPEQQAEIDAEDALYAGYEAEFEALYGDQPAPDPDCYTTPEAAQRATELHDAMSAAAEDIDAFGAPSECLSLACKPLERELDALEEKYGTRLNPPTLGEQYAERGLDDRTRSIAESLPAGMCDDRDILAALGERSAIDPDDCYAGVYPSNY